MAGRPRVYFSRNGGSRGSAKGGRSWTPGPGNTIGAVSSVAQREQIGDDGATVMEAALLGAWSGGLFGGLIGGAIGAARSGDQWEQVWP